MYLATEDKEIKTKIEDYYGDKIVTLDIPRYGTNQVWHQTSIFNDDRKTSGFNYCLEVGILAKCNALIASGSQGTLAAILLNDHRFDFLKIIDIGVYE